MGGGSSKNTAESVQSKNVIPPFKIVLRRCIDLAKTDSNGLTDCYIVGRFFNMRTDKYLNMTFKTSVKEKTLNPVFDEVHSYIHTYTVARVFALWWCCRLPI